LRNLALIILLGAKLGDRRFWEKLAVLCAAAGILTECLSEGKLLASDSLRHKALRAINSPENSFVCLSFLSKPFRGIVIHAWHYHVGG
jgi:hypothetical protein